jgi:Spirocyclase AveC-like
MAVVATRTEAADDHARPSTLEIAPKRVPPVMMWAVGGAAILAFQAYLMVKWVTGPYFKHVAAGPTPVPGWMHAELIAWQALSIPAAFGLIYWLFLRPWWKERRVGVDGLIAVAGISLAVQDPLSTWAQPWFTYNSSMLNFGSWVAEMPGVSAFHAPGAMVDEPVLFIFAAYVYVFVAVAAFGSWIMRRTRARYPRISSPALIGVCVAVMALVDLVLEGLIFLRLGVYEYAGGHWALLGEHSYAKYPLEEMVTMAPVFTAAACLRFFPDDRGHTIVERGLDQVQAGAGRKLALRVLATVALLNVAMGCLYTLPNTVMSINQPSWPKDLQQRSYLTDAVCGAGTDRVCPGPLTPVLRNGGIHLGPDGQAIVPDGVTPPSIIPFHR